MSRDSTFLLALAAGAVIAVVVAVVVVLTTRPSPGGTVANGPASGEPPLRVRPGIIGTADAAIWETRLRQPGDPHAHVDTPAMISRLKAVRANTYQFSIQYQTDWADLKNEFMPAAQKAGLNVIAYLMPPSECLSSPGKPDSCDLYEPFHQDYDAWAEALARLSIQYSNLRAWTIDDMDYHLDLFTPRYVQQLNATATAIAPKFNFYLQLYRPAITDAVVTAYESSIRGIIMPYRDDPFRNTASTDTFTDQMDTVRGLLAAHGRRLIVMIYGNSLSRTVVHPDVDYVTGLLKKALTEVDSGQIEGVIVWKLVLAATAGPAGDAKNIAENGRGALSLSVAPDTVTAAGQYAEASTSVQLSPGSSSCVLTLKFQDDRGASTADLGYHDKQVYVDNTLIWNRDIASEGTDWNSSSPLPITQFLHNGKGTLRIRLAELKPVNNLSVQVAFDDLSLTGCSIPNPTFENDDGWRLTRSGGPVQVSIYQYSPTYTTDVFTAVAALFA